MRKIIDFVKYRILRMKYDTDGFTGNSAITVNYFDGKWESLNG